MDRLQGKAHWMVLVGIDESYGGTDGNIGAVWVNDPGRSTASLGEYHQYPLTQFKDAWQNGNDVVVIRASRPAALNVTVVESPNPVISGQKVVYTLTVQNSGGSQIDNVILSDTLDLSITAASCSTSVGNCTAGGVSGLLRSGSTANIQPHLRLQPIAGTATAQIGTLASGGNAIVTITALAPIVSAVTNITNSASVTANGLTPVSVSAPTTVSPPPPTNITLNGTVSSDSTLSGQNVTYVFNVRNTGESEAKNVLFSDSFPNNASLFSCISSAGVQCENGAGVLTATLGTLPVDAVATFTVVLTMPSVSTTITLTNVASVLITNPETNTDDNQSAISVQVNPSPNSHTWTLLSPATRPLGRFSPAMAQDDFHHHILMFGGNTSGGPTPPTGPVLGDTWTWDGSNWTQQTPNNSPLPRFGSALSSDPIGSDLLLFGGLSYSSTTPVALLNDTWTWDGTNWLQRSPAAVPPSRYEHAMATSLAGVVLFGGEDLSGNPMNDTWIWDGTNWEQKFPTNTPPARYGQVMAFDSVRNEVVMFGGLTGTPGAAAPTLLNDTWIWDGDNWTQRSPLSSPPPKSSPAMAYDPVAGQMVLFGAVSANSYDLNTWLWDGHNWNSAASSPGQALRSAEAMAFDPILRRIVLFGGTAGGGLNDIWFWQR